MIGLIFRGHPSSSRFFLGALLLLYQPLFFCCFGHARGSADFLGAVSLLDTESQGCEADAFVLVLASFGAGGYRDSAWQVGDADRGFAAVLVLAAWAAGAEGFHVALGQQLFVGIWQFDFPVHGFLSFRGHCFRLESKQDRGLAGSPVVGAGRFRLDDFADARNTVVLMRGVATPFEGVLL